MSPSLMTVPPSAPPFDGEPDDGFWDHQVPIASGPAPDLIDGSPSGDHVQRFARVLVEVIAGARPARQLEPVTTERARLHLRRVGAVFAGSQPRLLRVLATRPAPDVTEATVIVGCGQRARAIALRLERRDPTRWICTEMEAG
jgi:hypothetical protein